MSLNRKIITTLLGTVFVFGMTTKAFELVHENEDPSKVVNTLSLSDSPWRSKVMVHPGKFLPKRDREWSGKDFFLDEFGVPCDFSNPKVGEITKFMRFDPKGKHGFKNGALEFTGGKKGFWFAFGPEPGTYGTPSLRFGTKWGKHKKDRYRIKLTISQNLPETEWEVSTFGFQKRYKNIKKFKVKGVKEQFFEADAGIVRTLNNPQGICGFRLDCITPNATVKIKDIKIAPYTGNAYFRKTFTLDEKPVMAHATYDAPVTYEIFINGEKVDKGRDIYPKGSVKTMNLKPYLKKGKNTIAVRKEFFNWQGGKPEYIFEGISVGKNGKITRILCPQGWKSSLKYQKGWMSPGFDDAKWKNPKPYERGLHQVITSWGSNGKNFWTGVEPRHMGMLQANPFGQKYPVWNYKEEAKFLVTLPAVVKDTLVPRLKIYKAQTKQLVKVIQSPVSPKRKDGLNEYLFKIKGMKTGAYRLIWELVDKAGKVQEKNRQELIIAGPIKQDKFGLAVFEEEFDKRLNLQRKIDCAKPVELGEEFCNHTGNISSPKVIKGGVIAADGMKYRETGKSPRDWYAYRLHDLKLGKPYLAEVIVPDNRDRYIYAGIIEQWPLGFECNFSSGDWPNHTSTGSCMTGIDQPLSMKTKKIRFIFWPGSKCSSIFVMSGFRAFPAAACEINIYSIKGDLPALKVPKSSRMFGSHNERISVMTLTTGISENPLMGANNRRKNGLRDGWLNWYRAIERKIKWLRFQGRNMTVEGVYMYWRGDYPSLKHNPSLSNQELDPPMLAIKMYNQNNINCMLGVEYQSSPQVWATKANHTSDKRVWETGEGIHQVDKYGRQVAGSFGSGVNFMHPKGSIYILDCIGEIYDFYKDTGTVAGLFMVAGGWWQPAFTTASLTDIASTDVGYSDYTVGLFEKETGIKLKIDPKDPTRFMKRYDKLMGEHKDLWLFWRAQKTREFFGKIRKLVSSGNNKWPLYIKPSLRIQENPFLEVSSTRAERDKYLDKCYTESGLPLELYKDNPNINLVGLATVWAKFMSPYSNWMYCKGMTNNRGTRKIVKDLDAIYFHLHKGLDEVDQPASAADKWIWSKTGRGVFLPRWAGENAMAEYVNVLSWTIPRILFYGWLDCNMDTGTGKEVRRFAKSFLVTPEAEFRTLPGKNVKGVIAESANKDGKTYLRLVNNSPWKSKGFFKVSASGVRDLVYDQNISSGFMSGGKYSIEMKPYDIRIFELGGASGKIYCNFNLQEKVEKEIFTKTEYLLNDSASLESIPGDLIALMFKALLEKDAFALRCLMDNFEAKAAIARAESNRVAIENQKKLIADLKKGRARIICATENEYKAPDGSRWLPDQKFTNCGAYGNEGATYADRGDLEIKGTDIDRVYQTEAYGARVFYKIPVPKGKYNVYIHFAETYVAIKMPNMRRIGVKVENIVHPERIDPFSLVGWGKPYVLEMKNISAYDGQIDIELTGGVGVNGIEIEKVK
jgi:malectin (di-glucose binding ER protein)/glycosyl hydrolase family 2